MTVNFEPMECIEAELRRRYDNMLDPAARPVVLRNHEHSSLVCMQFGGKFGGMFCDVQKNSLVFCRVSQDFARSPRGCPNFFAARIDAASRKLVLNQQLAE